MEKELTLWLQKNINKDHKIMDYVLEIHEIIVSNLKKHNLKFNKDYYIILMKLSYFLFINSTK